MISFPHCKINLGLQVIAKRDDGFHNIETCFYPLPFTDVLEIIPAQTMSFTNTGIIIPSQREENLCIRAYNIIKEKYDLSLVAIHLHKIVPIGAGLGGGSADGAFTFKLLNELFTLMLTDEQLTTFASQLGSDCSYFFHDRPMTGSGRGELLSPINLSLQGKYIVVVKPDVNVSTADAYKNIRPEKPELSIKNILEGHDIVDWKDLLFNDFERSIFRQYPEIKKIKDDLYKYGALYASMSGSGSSVFAIFKSPIDLRENFDGMIYWSGIL